MILYEWNSDEKLVFEMKSVIPNLEYFHKENFNENISIFPHYNCFFVSLYPLNDEWKVSVFSYWSMYHFNFPSGKRNNSHIASLFWNTFKEKNYHLPSASTTPFFFSFYFHDKEKLIEVKKKKIVFF